MPVNKSIDNLINSIINENYTFANKPEPADFGIGQAFFSDIGQMYYSDGTTWIAISSGAISALTVPTISDLLTVPVSQLSVIVSDPKRGGTFYWSASGTANGGTVFAGDSGFWVRQVYNMIYHVDWFGADDTATIDSTAAINAAIAAMPIGPSDGITAPTTSTNSGELHFGAGFYKVTATIALKRGIAVIGLGRETTHIQSFTTGSVFQYLDAGRQIPDRIAVRHMAIIQDASVTALSGAAVEVIEGPASVQAVSPMIEDLIIRGTYTGITVGVAINGAIRDCDVSVTVSHGIVIENTVLSSTSTDLTANYCHSCGGDGYRVSGLAYSAFSACASDANAGYGYYFDDSTTITFNGGAEGNALGSVYIKNSDNIDMNILQVGVTGAVHGISIEASRGIKLGGIWNAHATQTGYAVHVVSNGGTIELDGFYPTGIFATNICDTIEYIMCKRADSVKSLMGGLTANWTLGKVSGQTIDNAQLTIAGPTETTTYRGIHLNPYFTAAGPLKNNALTEPDIIFR